MMDVLVECYAGHRGEQTPRRFSLGNRWLDVDTVVDKWLGRDHRYFKVKAEDGAVYILRHESQLGVWELTLFNKDSPKVMLGG